MDSKNSTPKKLHPPRKHTRQATTNSASGLCSTDLSLQSDRSGFAILQRDIENEVKIREERFRSSLDNMIDPFIILHSTRDEHGRIVDFSFEFANASACSLFRLNKDDLNGMSLLENMPDHEQTGLLDQYIHVVETGRPLILDNFKYGVTQNGKRKSLILDLRANRLKDGLAVTWRNVTERIQTAAELAEVQDYLLDGIETERRKMARVLHDGPVQDLYAIDFLMHGFLHQNKDPEIACSCTNMQSMLHQVIETLQAIVGDLRPTALAPFGLNAAILSYVNGFYESHQNIHISLDLDEDRQTSTPDIEIRFVPHLPTGNSEYRTPRECQLCLSHP